MKTNKIVLITGAGKASVSRDAPLGQEKRMYKKSILAFALILGAYQVQAQELGDPLTDARSIDYANNNLVGQWESFKIKTVVYNGNKNLLDHIVLRDHIDIFSMGLLNLSELRTLRNSLYARYNYKFRSQDLVDHFSQFDWYQPQFDNVDGKLTRQDKSIIEQIVVYETVSNKASFDESSIVGQWEEFIGGANSEPASLKLGSDGSFTYNYEYNFSSEVKSIVGQWQLVGTSLHLKVTKIKVLLGGYYISGPGGAETRDGKAYWLAVDPSLEVSIPVSSAKVPSNYPSGKWIAFGGINMEYSGK